VRIQLDGEGVVSTPTLCISLTYTSGISADDTAWDRTLQEGVLSGHLIFPLNGSLAYLRVLWNFLDSETSLKGMILLRHEQSKHFLMKGSATAGAVAPLTRPTNAAEPLRGRICRDVHKIVTASLHVDEHGDYARGPVSDRV